MEGAYLSYLTLVFKLTICLPYTVKLAIKPLERHSKSCKVSEYTCGNAEGIWKLVAFSWAGSLACGEADTGTRV